MKKYKQISVLLPISLFNEAKRRGLNVAGFCRYSLMKELEDEENEL